MKKIALYAGAAFAVIFFLYATLSALVNQGLSIWGAIVMLVVIVAGGAGLMMAVKK